MAKNKLKIKYSTKPLSAYSALIALKDDNIDILYYVCIASNICNIKSVGVLDA